jgi:hypothetical protein
MNVIVLENNLSKTALKMKVNAHKKEFAQQVQQKLAVFFRLLEFNLTIIGS